MFKIINNPSLTWIFGKIKNAFVRIEALERKESYTKAEIDLKISEIQAGEAADLEGYYTKTEIDELLSSGKSGFTFQKVASLPSEGDDNIIYLVPITGSTNNEYEEYMYVDGKFERFGTADPDLSNYVANADLESIDDESIENIWKFQ